MIHFNDYQKQAYVAIQKHENNKEEVMHWAIGLGEEAGEALSVIKHKYYGGEYSVEDIVAELGDVMWNVAALCTALNLDMQDVVEYNLAKLQHRYPLGEFDEDRSMARHKLEADFRTSVARDKIMKCIQTKQRQMEENKDERI